MELIDKAALVSELEKRIEETKGMQPKFDQFWAGQISAFKGVLKILDTLEVKEVEKPIEIRFECIPVMASTEIGKSEYQIRANVTEDTLQQILKTKIIKML